MTRMDARRLCPDAQEDLRRRVVYAVREGGMPPSEAARTFGVCRQSGRRRAGAGGAQSRAQAAAAAGPVGGARRRAYSSSYCWPS
jgi:hypothetical protein